MDIVVLVQQIWQPSFQPKMNIYSHFDSISNSNVYNKDDYIYAYS